MSSFIILAFYYLQNETGAARIGRNEDTSLSHVWVIVRVEGKRLAYSVTRVWLRFYRARY